MNDVQITVGALRDAVRRFVDARDWRQFHSPKNLAMSIAIESAELMEHFQWIDSAESLCIRESPNEFQQVREELADILCYALSLANALDIDLSTAVLEKIRKNEAKYPADQFRGRFR
ncbi:MAG: nucleotide pyrophosphohydrolase [Phycisphaerae bacterium]|nr:nucleotide pyrophosphohydrolase [Phycisphaerae bacterium]